MIKEDTLKLAMGNADRDAITSTAFAVISSVQTKLPHDRLLGTAVALRLLVEGSGLNLRDVLEPAGNFVQLEQNANPHMVALGDLIYSDKDFRHE